MAQMIPDGLPIEGPGARAERALFEALRAGLSDDFFVYHRLPFLQGARASEGEIDFLVVHRDLGLLVLECKGHGVRRRGDGRWTRLDPDGTATPLRESPFEQARRNLHALVGELRARGARVSPPEPEVPLPFGYAVAFPLALGAEVNLPLDVDSRIVFDAASLADLGARVEAAMRFWKAERRTRTLSPAELKRYRRDVLHPATQLVTSVGARLRADREVLLRLSEEQTQTLEGLVHNRRLRVLGGAGTGKTVVATEAARLFAAQGKRVLLLCFNNALSRHLSALVEDDTHRITARSFHQLCAQAFELLGERPAFPDAADATGAQLFWNVAMAEGLVRALGEGKLARWDAVVVDEGQDIDHDWWPIIEDCLADRENGALAVFYDPAQNIFGRACHVPDYPAQFVLRTNFRNTKRIVAAVQALGASELRPHPRAPEGDPVGVHELGAPARTLDVLEALVRRLLDHEHVRPEQLAVITPHSRPNSLLRGLTALAGRPLADDPLQRRDAILHTTIGRFKGLEADVVILLDIDPADPRCGRNERYVASSRACQLLHVFAHGDWLA